MILVNNKTKTQTPFSQHLNDVPPRLYPTSDRRCAVKINGKDAEMVMHPKRDVSKRLYFVTPGKKEGTTHAWFIDNQELYDLCRANTKGLEFTIYESKAAYTKATAQPEPAKPAAKPAAAK